MDCKIVALSCRAICRAVRLANPKSSPRQAGPIPWDEGEKPLDPEAPVDPEISAGTRGKELVLKFTSGLRSEGRWSADSNGREMVQRTRNQRGPAYPPLVVSEPVAGNCTRQLLSRQPVDLVADRLPIRLSCELAHGAIRRDERDGCGDRHLSRRGLDGGRPAGADGAPTPAEGATWRAQPAERDDVSVAAPFASCSEASKKLLPRCGCNYIGMRQNSKTGQPLKPVSTCMPCMSRVRRCAARVC